MKSSGLRILTCGVPASSCTTSDRLLPILTLMVLSVRNEIILRISLGSSMSWSFFGRPLCHTASKAFSTSTSSRAARFFVILDLLHVFIYNHHMFICFLVWLVCPLPWIDDVVFYVFLYSIGDDFLEQLPHAV